MSNIKRIQINGEVRFDLGEWGSPEQKELIAVFSAFLTPSSGLKLTWANAPARYENTVRGGALAIYAFNVDGDEGVSLIWIQRLLDAVWAVGGTIQYVSAFDIENGGYIFHSQYNPPKGWEVYKGARDHLTSAVLGDDGRSMARARDKHREALFNIVDQYDRAGTRVGLAALLLAFEAGWRANTK